MTYYSITGVPILSPKNNELVFGDGILPPDTISRSHRNLVEVQRRANFLETKDFYLPSYLEDINEKFFVPKLEADNIYSHAQVVAAELAEPWYSRLNAVDNEIPPLPSPVLHRGWVRYPYNWPTKSYDKPHAVEHPLEDTFVFDVETMVTMGNHPIMAGAVSKEAFYIWLHDCLVKPNQPFFATLIPVGTGKLIIGHNVAFDRARVLEAHKIGMPENCFVDTMSLHNVSSGLTTEQKKTAAYMRSKVHRGNPLYFHFKGSAASLVEVYTYHMGMVGHTSEDKTIRNMFVKATSVDQIKENLASLIKYMCLDCYYTLEMFPTIWDKYKKHTPSKVSFVGMNTLLSSSQFTVVEDWYQWLKETEDTFLSAQADLSIDLVDMAVDLYNRWKEATPGVKREIMQDVCYRNLDWTIKVQNGTSEEVLERSFPLDITPIVWTKRASKYEFIPAWYTKIYKDGYKTLLSNKSVIAHFLLRVHWNGRAILYDKEDKFCYEDENGNVHKLPHKKGKDRDGEDLNVGGCLNKDFAELADQGVLTFEIKNGETIYRKALELSYWMSTRERVKQQRVFLNKSMECGVLIPQVIPHNTVTLRTGENLWLTVPDTDAKRIGTELKTRIQAPKGRKFVYFDFDSEEYGIFALYGDHNVNNGKIRTSCSSPTGFIAFGGNKENKSDPHWILSKSAGISRQIAKNVNYAVIYGGGHTTVTNTVHTGNRLMTRQQAGDVAQQILEKKKGKKLVNAKNMDCPVTQYEGGCDSAAFNFMERLVMDNQPRTPMLGRLMPVSLHWKNLQSPGTYKTNRINWTIQCLGTDMLATMCTFVQYLFAKYGIDGVFMFSYHDQILYSVDETQAYEAAYLINIAHMWTWALLRYQLDIYDFAVTNLFPSTTTIDTIFRKEGSKSTKTVSQVKDEPFGEDLNFAEILAKLSPEFLEKIAF